MFIRLMALLALILPVAAFAQVAPRTTAVEIIANGDVDVPASAFLVRLDWTSKGDDEAEALKAQAAQQANVRATLAALGVPDSAITITPGTDVATAPDYSSEGWLTNVTVVDVDEMNVADGDYTPPAAVSTVSDFAIVRLTSLAQVMEAERALSGIDVKVASITPMLDDNDGARRQAKAKALAAARGDADGYARILGMRVVRVIRISETGNGLFLPGFQSKFQQLISSGPKAFEAAFGQTAKPGFVHVEASIIVEFELAP